MSPEKVPSGQVTILSGAVPGPGTYSLVLGDQTNDFTKHWYLCQFICKTALAHTQDLSLYLLLTDGYTEAEI